MVRKRTFMGHYLAQDDATLCNWRKLQIGVEVSLPSVERFWLTYIVRTLRRVVA